MAIVQEKFFIGEIPALLWGESSDRLYIYVHGRFGCKEEAETFASVALSKGWQLLSFDLPGHGGRPDSPLGLLPWDVVPELEAVYDYAQERYKEIAVCGNSVGAFFSLLVYRGRPLKQAMFISPILDMEFFIRSSMKRVGVSEEKLKKEKIIPTNLGFTLTWRYLKYVSDRPLQHWDVPTCILYPGTDHFTPAEVPKKFSARFGAKLHVYPEGEHWFHTPEQMAVLKAWAEENMI